MITAFHTLVYSDNASATRAFFKDVLRWPFVSDRPPADDDATMADLSGRGATFAGQPNEMGYGRGVSLHVPGADDMLVYQPHHATAYDLEA